MVGGLVPVIAASTAPHWLNELLNPLALFGFAAQFLFMSRFLLQWYVSEKQKRSTVPVAFWWLSLAGGLSLGLYALLRRDPVFVLGQSLGVLIYSRNLVLIYRRKARIEGRRAERQAATETPAPDTHALLDDSLPLDEAPPPDTDAGHSNKPLQTQRVTNHTQ